MPNSYPVALHEDPDDVEAVRLSRASVTIDPD